MYVPKGERALVKTLKKNRSKFSSRPSKKRGIIGMLDSSSKSPSRSTIGKGIGLGILL